MAPSRRSDGERQHRPITSHLGQGETFQKSCLQGRLVRADGSGVKVIGQEQSAYIKAMC